MRGNIDLISQSGVVEGWCWDDANPDKRVTVALFSGRKECGRSTASSFRADLKEAGIGDGWHGFTLTIAPEFLQGAGTQQFSLFEVETGQPVGAPQDVRFAASVLLEERLNDLENRIEVLEQHVRASVEVQPERDVERRVFAMVGSFLSALGEGAALDGGVERFNSIKSTKPLPRIVLPRPAHPSALVIVEASAPVDILHKTLASLAASDAAEDAEYVVLANRNYPDGVLINALVSGHRYLRPVDTGADTLNLAIEATSADVILFVQAGALPELDAVKTMLGCFRTSPRIGALCAVFRSQDPSARPEGEAEDVIAAPKRHALEAQCLRAPVVVRLNELRSSIIAFRRKSLKECGGVDPSDMDDMGRSLRLPSAKIADAGWCVLRHRQALYTCAHLTEAGYWRHQEGDLHRTFFTDEPVRRGADIDGWGSPLVMLSSSSLKRDRDTIDLLWMQGISCLYIGNDPQHALSDHVSERGGLYFDISATTKIFDVVHEAIVLTNGGIMPVAKAPKGVSVCDTLEEALVMRSRSLHPTS